MKKMLVLSALFAGCLASSVGAEGLMIGGKAIPSDQYLVDKATNRTLVPIRFVSESLGAKVDWDAKTRKVMVKKGETSISLTVDSKSAIVNGQSKTLDQPAKLVKNRTYVPVRFVGEALGAEVGWGIATNKMEVSEQEKAQVIAELKKLPIEHIKFKTLEESHNYAVEDQMGNWYHEGRITEFIKTAIAANEAFYNQDYRNINQSFIDKNLSYRNLRMIYEGESLHPKEVLKKVVEDIKKDKVVMEMQFITDPSLFYLHEEGEVRVRGQQRFIIRSHSNPPEGIKIGQWYKQNVDVRLGLYATNIAIDWEYPEYTFGRIIDISKPIPINE